MKDSKEEWRWVEGQVNRYAVSSLGRVSSFCMGKQAALLSQRISHKGYAVVCLTFGGKTHTIAVHRLVAGVFIGPREDGLEVCHGNKGKLDNSVSNLRYDTHRGNMSDRYCALTLERVALVIKLQESGEGRASISRISGVGSAYQSAIRSLHQLGLFSEAVYGQLQYKTMVQR